MPAKKKAQKAKANKPTPLTQEVVVLPEKWTLDDVIRVYGGKVTLDQIRDVSIIVMAVGVIGVILTVVF